MELNTWIVVGIEAFWFVSLLAVGVLHAVRHRVLVTSGLGWLLSAIISTTGKPLEAALPLGLLIGSGAAVGLSLATRRGVTFTWMPDKVYWLDEGRRPFAENVLMMLTSLYFCTAAAIMIIRG